MDGKLVEQLTVKEAAERLERISLKDADHLKKWLASSGRRWIILDSQDLVDSLPYPSGIEFFMEMIDLYRGFRATKLSGRVEKQIDPTLGVEIDVPIKKTDTLEAEEMDRAIRFLVGQISEIDPGWSLDNPSM
jgi:hypothetical protein